MQIVKSQFIYKFVTGKPGYSGFSGVSGTNLQYANEQY